MVVHGQETSAEAPAIRVLLAQRFPVAGECARNAADAAELLAAYPDVDLAVFPELFLCGYDVAQVHRYGLGPDAEPLGVLRRACAASGTALVAGFAERDDAGGPPYNAMLCADRDGSVAGVYRKTHLYGAERTAFTAGDRLACVTLAGIRIAPMICFDLEIPEVARTLARDHPALLVAIAANMDPYAEDHELASRSRALENRTPLIYVNRAGAEADLTFTGNSLATDGNAHVLTHLGRQPATAVVTVPLQTPVPPELDYRTQLRPDLYG